jgi:cyanophycinase
MKNSLLLLPALLLSNIGCHSQEDSPPAQGQVPPYYSIGITGSKEDVQTTTEFGLVLMGGGTDVDAAIQWMIEKSGGGDFLILRASGSTGYNSYIYDLGNVNSVETLLLNSKNKADNVEVGKRIREAEALFIAGGDQSNYVNFWGNTETSKAINYLLNEKKVPVGGTSAGCAVLSEIIFDAKQGSVISAEALANPYDPLVSLSSGFIQAPFLEHTLADQHYSQRERQGRLVAFLARMEKDFAIAAPKGIGVDEKTAVCIDKEGNATVMGTNKAYFLRSENSGPEICETNQPLTWDRNAQAIQVFVYTASASGTNAFNLTSWPTVPSEYWYVQNGVLKINK